MRLSRTAILLAMLLTAAIGSRTRADDGPVEFAREIRPILSDHCFKCHGPDEKQREAELRLDREDSVMRPREGYRILTPGKPDASELYRRLTSNDPDVKMPPPSEERQPTPAQIELIRRWIAEGAKWQMHWAFRTPQRPVVPDVSRPEWLRNPIDAFILRRLEREELKPSPEADRRTLIRRVTFDLTGLPPTPKEVEAFVSDDSPDAYERVVERLLASPRYGERMAGDWLDAARYADTSGYQNDGPREMWRWRDWVIDAYNDDMPFDEFTVEQLAGDMLPGATLSQKIATGFNRNHRGNAEGGIIPEEYAVEYVVDRIEATSTVWMGLTLGCTRCHEHKFDPFSQEEFYRLFAIFGNIPEHGRAIKEGNSPPYIKAPTEENQRQLGAIEPELNKLAAWMKRKYPARLAAAFEKWSAKNSVPPGTDWTITDGLVSAYTFDEDSPPFQDGDATFAPHGTGRAAVFDGKRFVNAGDVGNFGYFDRFTLSAWIKPDEVKTGTIVSRMVDVYEGNGYSVRLVDGKVEVDLVKRWLDDSIRVKTSEQVVAPGEWTHVAVTYDGSRVARGVHVSINGRPVGITTDLDFINQSFDAAKEPLRIGAGHGVENRFRGAIDDVRVFDLALDPQELAIVAEPATISDLLARPRDQRGELAGSKLGRWFLRTQAPEAIRRKFERYEELLRQYRAIEETIPTVMVMQENPERRPTYVLKRGEYDKPGEEVMPGVPDAVDVSHQRVRNRLEFARWLIDPRHPLTARVAVNRLWQQLFGTGLVKTAEDFGSQGEPPSHPELLDWLATELIRLDWDVKALQKTIVTSATYRQSSKVSPDLLARDPDNRLLARGPRMRLSARMVRDQALFVSGLLTERLGGPSVKPYQPEGLWKEIATTTDYKRASGPDLYRRSLYTYWKRTVAPPTMAIFDAAGREMCVVRTARTNTPLQALALMNDVTFVEASRVLAERAFREADATPAARIDYAFRVVLSRTPTKAERTILLAAWDKHLANYRSHPAEARALITLGDSPADASIDRAELAAMTTLCGLILNLDEAITKE